MLYCSPVSTSGLAVIFLFFSLKNRENMKSLILVGPTVKHNIYGHIILLRMNR